MIAHKTLEKMLADLSLSSEQLVRVVSRAPYSYKTYSIPKKNGGLRIISQPARETKYVQHWLIHNVFHLLPIHEAASAYVKGASIKKNAEAHRTNEYMVKLDFKDFFPSIKIDDLIAHFQKSLPFLDLLEIRYIARLSCINRGNGGALSIGSPASPILSNSIMYEFDSVVADWASQNKFVYTRYADDLTFSTALPYASESVVPVIKDLLSSLKYPRLSLNVDKTIHLSKRGSRRITGLVITNDDKVSLGRDRKREISALVHKYGLGLLEQKDVFRLQGLLGFAADVEPLFLSRLGKKYGMKTILNLLRKRQ
ncbi:retron St85 family RNA-directed DNA polymerase [Pseudomonas tolaasii]|uniref:retron St85 family RNA-directed DNA polymerase n=1 Tax=Pseudomonas TaxID=286 RepID=UPI0011455C1C|nr:MULTISPECIES: retron St85 family RNA-directed DNA polymerase [unclassified Pseudomonas]MBD9465109.1 RNA-directed DNA polymerase [Pseudomonas sp. Pdm06]MBW1250031.1 retron St85 family RNA-directed DNA polymerase [Pseudomonas tolaasii]MCK9749330.1 retron St85 family RNA-directed DNA polymerase [Pseudomonas syringae pv. syringae]